MPVLLKNYIRRHHSIHRHPKYQVTDDSDQIFFYTIKQFWGCGNCHELVNYGIRLDVIHGTVATGALMGYIAYRKLINSLTIRLTEFLTQVIDQSFLPEGYGTGRYDLKESEKTWFRCFMILFNSSCTSLRFSWFFVYGHSTTKVHIFTTLCL